VPHNRFIRNFFAAFLLAIFALCNTPTKVLHQLFARHADFISTTLHDSNNPQLSVAGIDCHCQSNVVIAPYTFENGFVIRHISSGFADYALSKVSEIPFSQPITFGLRGPPALV
jgi:hypothetical protein